jgi:hypothetical protein
MNWVYLLDRKKDAPRVRNLQLHDSFKQIQIQTLCGKSIEYLGRICKENVRLRMKGESRLTKLGESRLENGKADCGKSERNATALNPPIRSARP